MQILERAQYVLQAAQQRPLVVFVRTASIIFVPLYVWSLFGCLFDYDLFVSASELIRVFSDLKFDWYYRASYSWEYAVGFFFVGVLVNFGSFFITTEASRKYRVLSTVLYLPTIVATPFVIGIRQSLIFVIVLFVGSLVVYDCFNPWRQE